MKRKLTATAPSRLWVTDPTFVPTWEGVAYVCFIIDAYSRRIVAWRCASHMCTEMVLDAIEMARWSRGHQPRGFEVSQRRVVSIHVDSLRRTTCRGGRDAVDRTVGDSFDNALAETENGYYKTELVRGPDRPDPWRTVEDLELATLGWVHWHTQRLHGYLCDIPPAEFEQAFYAGQTTTDQLVGIE